MKKLLFPLALLFFFISCDTQNPKDENSPESPVDNSLVLPEGFSAYVVAEELGNGRHIVVNDNGDVYVSLRRKNNGGGIVALRDTNNDVKADIIEYFGDYPGTGIGLHKGYLYFGSDREVMRYPLNQGDFLPDLTPEVIATGFPVQNQHEVKPFTFDNDGNMYIKVGSRSNSSM